MNPFRRLGHPVTVALLFASLVSPLTAQQLLFAEYGGKMCLVRRVRDTRPCVEVDGKLVVASGNRYALRKVEEYLPVFISVRNLNVRTTSMGVVGSAAQLNQEFHFKARFESPYQLDDVFIVLDLDTESAGRMLFLYEIGRLQPRESKPVSLTIPLEYALGAGHFQIHLFAGGMEVLHSEIPFYEREAALDRMVAKRIKSMHDAEPKLFIGPTPEYPAALLKTKTKGEAVVAVRISSSGRTLDPEVKSASNPAFGEAALAAVRLWRFLPKVKDDRPLETKAEIPFDFAPP
ncbi:MAG: energy transducer TonB [Opitutaceae bacterium]|nr:energy transducer TonB [Opitutaceae bacterium]